MTESDRRPRVLFLCTGNCCRSQMAEGLFREAAGERYESLSAGAAPAGFVHPLAIAALGELGIDITDQDSKSIRDFLPPKGVPPDLVISVCEAAGRECPTFPGNVARLSWPFPDPIYAQGSTVEKLKVFRQVRELIRERIRSALAGGEIDAALR